MTGTPANLQVQLRQRPTGVPGDDCWNVLEVTTREPADGEFLVRNRYISVDPAMRGWINEGRSYVEPVAVGEVMRAGAVGEVVQSRNDQFPEGSCVSGLFGVQRYALSDGKGVISVDPGLAPLPVYLATLGMPGMTAYFGLLEVGAAKEGETVVVSAAAGAVGQVVGQIAKIKGCRTVGIAGGPEKCAWVTEELGFDACIDYRNADLRAGLREHCPRGIDVYFDNVGGDILDIALTRLAMHARVVICGAISQYNNMQAMKGPANYMSLLVNRARMEGFVVFDYAKRYGEAAKALAGWMQDGSLKTRIDEAAGLETFPATFRKLFSGENFGKLVIAV